VLKAASVAYRPGMGIIVNRSALAAGFVAAGVLLGSCSASTTDAEPPSTVIAADSDALRDEAISAMCRTLDLFSSAGTPAGNASAAMTKTDLEAATTSERAIYGRVLIEAPTDRCPEHTDYAREIAYWLGF
jgi:hypothetical protein